jgi:hypothetical protein
MAATSLIDRLQNLHKTFAEKHPNELGNGVESSVNWPAWTEWVNGPPWRNIADAANAATDERKR